VEFSRLDVSKPEAVARFITSLCGLKELGRWTEDPDVLDSESLLESLWSYQGAPRKRMAKLCWQLLVGHDRQQYFSQYFTLDEVWLARQAVNCARILGPIQRRLRWVLNGFQERQEKDRFIGQGNWGEEWLLPRDQTSYVRKHLGRARPALLEESSNYEDSLRYFTTPYFEVTCNDSLRVYVGEHQKDGQARVWIEDRRGTKYPLTHATRPFDQVPGGGFSWGYAGSGPSALSLSILADAVSGDLEIANKLRVAFIEEVVAKIPGTGNLRISNESVLKWLLTKNIGQKELVEAEVRVKVLQKAYGAQIADHRKRLKEIEEIGGLRMQRFDIVPPDFESALYVDLMHMFERAGWVLHCNRCGQPLACERSPRGNRQRARWLAGKPIYHEWCFSEHRRDKKRIYWAERSKAPSFRASERDRGRKRRKRN
jgi:hypothetical protein